MLRDVIARVAIIAGVISLFGKCKDLERELAVKQFECEVYKAILNTATSGKRNEEKKEK